MQFVIPGPGAKGGISKCFASLRGLSEADIIRVVADRQEIEFERLGINSSRCGEGLYNSSIVRICSARSTNIRASYHTDQPLLLTATIRKDRAAALKLGRSEQEIIVIDLPEEAWIEESLSGHFQLQDGALPAPADSLTMSAGSIMSGARKK
jgi:hypothetical protein